MATKSKSKGKAVLTEKKKVVVGVSPKPSTTATATADADTTTGPSKVITTLSTDPPLLEGNLSTIRVIVIGTLILIVATAGFYYIPGLIDKEQYNEDAPEVHHLVDAFYCAAITLST
jgi:hypothetical protein